MSLVSSKNPLPVLIIGAGLGGLTLANSLQRYGIPYRIFERDSHSSKRPQGYRISIDGNSGGAGLKEALTPELFELFKSTCGAHRSVGARIDGPSGKVLARGIMAFVGAGGWTTVGELIWRLIIVRWERMRVMGIGRWLYSWVQSPPRPLALPIHESEYKIDRATTRAVLLTNQSEHITYDANFQSYTLDACSRPDGISYTNPDGLAVVNGNVNDIVGDFNGVTAHFADGTSIKGSLLVGADGIRSKVASQLVGSSMGRPIDLGPRIVYGKTPLTPEIEAAMHPDLRIGCGFVTDTQTYSFNGQGKGNEGEEKYTNTNTNRVREKQKKEGEKVLLVIEPMRFNHPSSPPNYIFWALSAQPSVFCNAMPDYHPNSNISTDSTRSISSDSSTKTTDQTLDDRLLSCQGSLAAEISIGVTSHWDPRLRIIFEHQDITQTATLRLTSSDPNGPPRWDTNSKVTVLGDAIHCMPPTGGQGANSAIRDAAVLGKALGESIEWQEWTKRQKITSTTSSENKADDSFAGDGQKFTGWTKETITKYEDEMRFQIGDIVGLACIAAKGMIGAVMPNSESNKKKD